MDLLIPIAMTVIAVLVLVLIAFAGDPGQDRGIRNTDLGRPVS